MTKRITGTFFFTLLVLAGFTQTNPVAQTLPFSLTSQSGNSLPAGVAVHRFGTSAAAIPTTRILTPANGDLPYTATANAGGWRDEATDGISMLASSAQSAGALIVAINTTGKTNIQVQWTVKLILQQTFWDNSIALQYRVGTSGNFINVGTTSTYSSTGQTAGNSASFSEILPAGADNQPVVQVRWIYWASAGASGSRDRLSVDDISIDQGIGPCTTPANQPTNISLTPALYSIDVAFSAAVPAVDGYLVLRSLSSSLTNTPVDGTSYTAGQTLGNATVVSSAATTSMTDNGLTPNTPYHYFIFAYNSVSCTGGPAYLVPTPLYGTTSTLALPNCNTPAAAPTGLLLTASGQVIVGSFTREPSANNYLIVYSLNPALSFTPTNGVLYSQGQHIGPDIVLSYSNADSFFLPNLAFNTTYYVFVFSSNNVCTGEPFYNTSSLNGSATTTTGFPAGYYAAANALTCQNLKTALRNIITPGQVSFSYGSLDDTQMPIVDTIRSDDGASAIIWDIYTNNPIGPEPFTFNSGQNPSGGFCVGSTPGSEGGCWNKEHTFPRSWFKLGGSAYQQPTEADLFIVRPADSKINGNRGNIPYSQVGSTTYQFPTSGSYPGYPMPPNPVLDKIGASNFPGVTAASAFEPYDGVKGDVARSYFYVLTRYQNELANWVTLNGASGITTAVDGTTNGGIYPSFQLSYLYMMYTWHILDPVDQKEKYRNDLVYTQQYNRNPFIDNPDYVALVWQCTGVLPVTILDFTGTMMNESVLLNWTATQETRFRNYNIQRSTDGVNFYTIGSVEGKNLSTYSYLDKQLPNAGVAYYRLQMVDIDGKAVTSKVVIIRLKENYFDVQVFPNPAADQVSISLSRPLTQVGQLSLSDISGRIVMKQNIPSNQKTIALDAVKLAAGRYFISIISNSRVIHQSFVVSR